MKTPFKFFRQPILRTHNGTYVYAEEYFYSMNKEDTSYKARGGKIKVTPKYTIVQRFLPKIYQDKFKPDYDKLLYFKTMAAAEFYKDRLIHWDTHIMNRE